MKKGRILLWLLVCLSLFGCSSKGGYAYKSYVVDEANQLDAQQEASLQQQCEEFADRHQAEVVLLLTMDTGGKSSVSYADDYYDENGYGYNEEMGDGVLLLIDLENRMIWLSSSGSMLNYFNTYESCEAVTDTMVASVQQQDYASAFSTGIRELDSRIRSSQIKTGLLLILLPSLLVATLVTAILYVCFRGVDRRSVDSDTYRRGEPKLLEHYDRFTHRSTHSRKIESDNSRGGSGGGTHRSSSGNSHGGGGSRF